MTLVTLWIIVAVTKPTDADAQLHQPFPVINCKVKHYFGNDKKVREKLLQFFLGEKKIPLHFRFVQGDCLWLF